MPPYSRRTLKRKYSGRYQPSSYVKRSRVVPNSRTRVNTAVFATNPTRKVEIKALDLNFTGTLGSSGTIILLNGMAIGDGTNEREGKAIQSQFWRYNFNIINNSNVIGETFDIFLVYDKQPNGITPVWLDIFVNGVVPTNPRQDTKQRYVVVKEWHNSVTNNTVATQAVVHSPSVNYNGTIPMKKMTMYLGTGATISSINQGALFLCMISRSASANYLVASQFAYIDI